MTKQEHNLTMGMMAGLYQFSMTLFEILKSNDLASDDDLPAFSALVSESEASGNFAALYRQQAESLGLRIL